MPRLKTDTPFPEAMERERLGAALRSLRVAAGLTIEQVAGRVERPGRDETLTPQAWQNYERGRRRFTPELIETVTKALGLTPQDLLDERERLFRPAEPAAFARPTPDLMLPVDGVGEGGLFNPGGGYGMSEPEVIDFASFFGPDWRVLRLAGDSMAPYAEPGGFVTFSLRRPPRRGQGCVIITTSGEHLVKRFERTTADELVVTELHPEIREVRFPLSEIRGVYAIGLRGD